MDPDIEEGAVSDDAAAQISAAFAAVEEVDNPDDPRHALKEYVPPGSEKPAAEEVEADSPEAKVSPAAEKPASAETPAAKPADKKPEARVSSGSFAGLKFRSIGPAPQFGQRQRQPRRRSGLRP